MKVLKSCFSALAIIILSTNILNGQTTTVSVFTEPEFCYYRCIIDYDYSYDEHEETYFIYIGENNPERDENVVKLDLVIESKDELVKGPRYIEDLFECFEPVNEIETIFVVKDTSKTKDFINETFLIKETQVEEVKTEWLKGVCNSRGNSPFIKEIQQLLTAENKYSGPLDGLYNKQLEAAIEFYQIENELPIGGLNLTTLTYLGFEL